MKQVDTGGLSFQEIREDGKYYVDKSLLIKDMLETNDRGVYLYTRPRRFGKTTNITMLDAFFNLEYKGNAWFDGLAISECPEYASYKNRFPVISLNLKDTVAEGYDEYVGLLRNAIRRAFLPFRHLLDRGDVYEDEKDEIRAVLNRTLDITTLSSSLLDLSEILSRCHGEKVVILIDEYDRAVMDSLGKDIQKDIVRILSQLLSSTLKNNDNLQMGYVTGISQITKADIFSGLNNLSVNNVFSIRSDERFGFTEDDVERILEYYGHPEKIDEVRSWYDGYRFGNAEIYNPFSVMKYVQEGFRPKGYWVGTSSDNPARWLLRRTDASMAEFSELLAGSSLNRTLNDSISSDRLSLSDTDDLHTLMVLTGYLKAVPLGGWNHSISIPNGEVMEALDRIVAEGVRLDSTRFDEFCLAVLDGDVDRMTETLQFILVGSSYMTGRAEFPYEAVLMTIMRGIVARYDTRVEREEGNGRVDIVMIPKRDGEPSMIFELKVADTENALDSEAGDAIAQIHERKYYLGMTGRVMLYGISFWGKVPRIKLEVLDLRRQPMVRHPLSDRFPDQPPHV